MSDKKDLRLHEELAHRIATEAAERRELTPELRGVSQRLHGWIHDRLDALDRNAAVALAVSRRRRHKRPRQ